MVSSNNPNLKEWAKSRVNRIDFDVYFAPTASIKAQLSSILEELNQLFRWFSTLYLQALRSPAGTHDDELHIARQVVRELYAFAERPLPPFYPSIRLEKLYDPGRLRWLGLLFRSRQALLRKDRDRLFVM